MTFPPDPAEPLAELEALELLAQGEISVHGRMAAASNATLFGTVTLGDLTRACIYKPRRGERPLWDFPGGTLSHREVAAFMVSQATGWDVVPPTVWRDGPFGEGSVQLWIDADPESEFVAIMAPGESGPGWLSVLRAANELGQPVDLVHADDPRLARMAVFDIVVDNADRKGGHILGDARGHIWGVDHGLTFNAEAKLRTVLWGWGGRELPAECLDVLAALAVDLTDSEPLGGGLAGHLSTTELVQTRSRINRLLASKTFPRPNPDGPMIPWPAF